MDVLRWEATPVEIQQLVSNLCANASSVDHLSGGGGDPWYDGKDLLAILWQEQVQMVKGPKITNDSNNINNNTAVQTNWETYHFWNFDWPSEVLLDCSDLSPARLPRLLSFLHTERTETDRWGSASHSERKSLQKRASSEYSRYYRVRWHNVFYFFGPRIDKTKPLTLQGDKGAVFCFELVAVCLYFFFTSQHCGEKQGLHDRLVANYAFRLLQTEREMKREKDSGEVRIIQRLWCVMHSGA